MTERPACRIIAAETAYLLYSPRSVHGVWYASLAGAEASVRVQFCHENGAEVTVLTPDNTVIRTFVVEGDGKPYPEPIGQMTA